MFSSHFEHLFSHTLTVIVLVDAHHTLAGGDSPCSFLLSKARVLQDFQFEVQVQAEVQQLASIVPEAALI